MTLAVALRVGSKVVIHSDTLITDDNWAHPEVLPGRLKTLVLSKNLTVAYSGLAVQAVDSLRKPWLRATESLSSVTDHLAETAAKHGGKVEYLVCSHLEHPKPRLVKVTADGAVEGADRYWIGHADAARAVAAGARPTMRSGVSDLPDEEQQLADSFRQYVEGSRNREVGGVPITTICIPDGHHYLPTMNLLSTSGIRIGSDGAIEIEEEFGHEGGKGSYIYHLSGPPTLGDPVLGLYLPQPRMAYIYAPLKGDRPERRIVRSVQEFHAVIAQVASDG